MQEIERFSTERLLAERMAEEHFDDLVLLWQDPRVMATLGGVRTEQLSREELGQALDQWTVYGFGNWVLREKTSGEFVGNCGLRCLELDGWPEVDLGYALRVEFWGQGLATEAAKAVVSLGFGKLGMEDMIAIALPNNIASRRVMEKSGFQYERDTVYKDLPHVLYRVTRGGILQDLRHALEELA